MPFTIPHHTVRASSWCVGLLLATTLVATGCNASRTSTFAPDAAPSAVAEGVTVRIERATLYDGGIELSLAIDNRSATPIRFPRMQTSFPTLQLTDGGVPVSATRIERGARVPFAAPYAVAAGSLGRLIVQFNRAEPQGERTLTLRVQAQQGAARLAWDIALPPEVLRMDR